MSTVFTAVRELSEAAFLANVSPPRMVLEFATYESLRKFEGKMLQDHRAVAADIQFQDVRWPLRRLTWMGVELVLSVRE
jgi:hypothetical protein